MKRMPSTEDRAVTAGPGEIFYKASSKRVISQLVKLRATRSLLVLVCLVVVGLWLVIERFTWQDLSANALTELLGILVTVLIVDAIYERRNNEREKRDLTLQMGSPDNAFGLEAVRKLRALGWLAGGSLRWSTILNANLAGADLIEANLEHAYMPGTVLREGTIYRCNLSQANLFRADISKATIQETDLSESTLLGANLAGTKLFDVDLSRADLVNADFGEAQFCDVKLSGANLQGANLKAASLSGIHPEGKRLFDQDTLARIERHDPSDLSYCDLSGAVLRGADLRGCNLTGAIVSPEQLAQAQSISGAILPNGDIAD